MSYRPKHFVLQELVPQYLYQDRGEAAWELLDDRMLMTLDQLRERFGTTIINTWHSEMLMMAYGRHEWRGLRTPQCEIGAKYSQHLFGRAADCVFRDWTAEQVRNTILEEQEEFKYINAIEMDTSWLHFDVRNSATRIRKFYP